MNAALRSGGGAGQQFAESFDLDIMMPPDIASIDSDLSKFTLFPYQFNVDKLSALTPNPL